MLADFYAEKISALAPSPTQPSLSTSPSSPVPSNHQCLPQYIFFPLLLQKQSVSFPPIFPVSPRLHLLDQGATHSAFGGQITSILSLAVTVFAVNSFTCKGTGWEERPPLVSVLV